MLSGGDRVAHYVVETALGAGGMGEVYVAFDERLERRVALKLLPAARTSDQEARGRMLREARAASSLNHPGIVTIYEIGEDDERTYIGMELVEGETLAQLAARRGRLPPEEALELVRQAGAALEAAHEAGILHRDVKPANLMLDRRGRVKVLDFGLSKRVGRSPQSQPPAPASQPPVRERPIDPGAPTEVPSAAPPLDPGVTPLSGSFDPVTMHGARMGTPGSAALELMRGEEADARSDVFSLAIVLYELVCGARPFPVTGWRELEERMAAEQFEPPSRASGGAVDARLDEVMSTALRAHRDQRYPTVRAFVDAAAAALGARPQRRRSALWLGGLAAAAAGGVAAFYVAGGRGSAAPDHADEIDAETDPGDAGTGEVAEPALVASGSQQQVTRAGGCAYSPIFGDSGTLVYDRTLGDAVDLYRVSIAGGEPVQLTTGSTWEWRAAAGSRPGEVLYIVADVNLEARRAATIAALDLATGRSRPVASASTGSIAAAGGDFYFVQTGGSEIRRIRGGVDEIFLALPDEVVAQELIASADGARLAVYGAQVNGRSNLCTTPVGRAELRCAPVPVIRSRPAFSSDGRSIYYAGQDGIHRFEIEGARDRVLLAGTQATGGLAVAPDGSALAWSDCRARAQLVEVTARPPRIIDDQDGRDPTTGPGGQLAWVRVGESGGVIMVRGGDGISRQLTRGDGVRVAFPSFNPRGSRVAFVRGGEEGGVHVIDVEASMGAHRVTESTIDDTPVWVDDDRVAFTRWHEGVPYVWIAGVSGQDAHRLLDAPRLVMEHDPRRGTLIVATGDGHYTNEWDPRTGRERAYPMPRGIKVAINHMDIAPGGRWMLLQAGRFGQKLYRARLQPPGALALVYEAASGQTVGRTAIDDAGRIYAGPETWSGELHLVRPAPGRRF